MRIYLGTKVIQAEPMDYATFAMQVKPVSGLVEVDSGGKGKPGYKVVYPPFKLGDDSYVSWSPKDVFENAYREVTEAETAVFKT